MEGGTGNDTDNMNTSVTSTITDDPFLKTLSVLKQLLQDPKKPINLTHFPKKADTTPKVNVPQLQEKLAQAEKDVEQERAFRAELEEDRNRWEQVAKKAIKEAETSKAMYQVLKSKLFRDDKNKDSNCDENKIDTVDPVVVNDKKTEVSSETENHRASEMIFDSTKETDWEKCCHHTKVNTLRNEFTNLVSGLNRAMGDASYYQLRLFSVQKKLEGKQQSFEASNDDDNGKGNEDMHVEVDQNNTTRNNKSNNISGGRMESNSGNDSKIQVMMQLELDKLKEESGRWEQTARKAIKDAETSKAMYNVLKMKLFQKDSKDGFHCEQKLLSPHVSEEIDEKLIPESETKSHPETDVVTEEDSSTKDTDWEKCCDSTKAKTLRNEFTNLVCALNEAMGDANYCQLRLTSVQKRILGQQQSFEAFNNDDDMDEVEDVEVEGADDENKVEGADEEIKIEGADEEGNMEVLVSTTQKTSEDIHGNNVEANKTSNSSIRSDTQETNSKASPENQDSAMLRMMMDDPKHLKQQLFETRKLLEQNKKLVSVLQHKLSEATTATAPNSSKEVVIMKDYERVLNDNDSKNQLIIELQSQLDRTMRYIDQIEGSGDECEEEDDDDEEVPDDDEETKVDEEDEHEDDTRVRYGDNDGDDDEPEVIEVQDSESDGEEGDNDQEVDDDQDDYDEEVDDDDDQVIDDNEEVGHGFSPDAHVDDKNSSNQDFHEPLNKKQRPNDTDSTLEAECI